MRTNVLSILTVTLLAAACSGEKQLAMDSASGIVDTTSAMVGPNANGVATMNITLGAMNNSGATADGGHYVQVHDRDGKPTACGNVVQQSM